MLCAQEARQKLQFKVVVTFHNELYFNTARVEAKCQQLQHLPKTCGGLHIGVPGDGSGSGRLWRVCGAGGFGLYKKFDVQNAATGTPTLVKLFHCYSALVPELIRAGKVKYVY